MSKKKKKTVPNKRKKGWDRTRRGRKSQSPVPPLRNNMLRSDDDNSNLQEDLLLPSAMSPVVRPSSTIRSTLKQGARSNTRLQSVKFKLTDSNASLKAELEQVRHEKSNVQYRG